MAVGENWPLEVDGSDNCPVPITVLLLGLRFHSISFVACFVFSHSFDFKWQRFKMISMQQIPQKYTHQATRWWCDL